MVESTDSSEDDGTWMALGAERAVTHPLRAGVFLVEGVNDYLGIADMFQHLSVFSPPIFKGESFDIQAIWYKSRVSRALAGGTRSITSWLTNEKVYVTGPVGMYRCE
jgi:hypothetical protein